MAQRRFALVTILKFKTLWGPQVEFTKFTEIY